MAAETVPRADGAAVTCGIEAAQPRADLVPALGALLADIAGGLHSVRNAIFDCAESDQEFAFCDALAKLGWMADHGARLAGETSTICNGNADEWLLPPRTRELLKAAA